MARPQFDPSTGETYPAYGSFNDKDMLKTQPKTAIPLIYVVKANGKLNSEIHSNCYSQLYAGRVTFLIKEQEAKNKLMATKVGQKMKVEDKAKRLLPHELTTRLLDECANLRLRDTGNQTDVVLEQINTRFGKDKFSASTIIRQKGERKLDFAIARKKGLEQSFGQKTSAKNTAYS